MIGNFTLNGKKHNVISSWEELTFSQYLRVIKMKGDLVETVSILTGIDYEVIKKAKVKGLEKILFAAKFLNEVPKIPPHVKKIGKYKLPLNSKGIFDIRFESLEQFEDLRQVISKVEATETGLVESYPKMLAIYLQKIRDKEYHYDKAESMVPEIFEMPALEVISAGSFFLTKLLRSLTGTEKKSPKRQQTRKQRTGMRSRKSSHRMR